MIIVDNISKLQSTDDNCTLRLSTIVFKYSLKMICNVIFDFKNCMYIVYISFNRSSYTCTVNTV